MCFNSHVKGTCNLCSCHSSDMVQWQRICLEVSCADCICQCPRSTLFRQHIIFHMASSDRDLIFLRDANNRLVCDYTGKVVLVPRPKSVAVKTEPPAGDTSQPPEFPDAAEYSEVTWPAMRALYIYIYI